MALEATLACPRSFGEGHSCSSVTPSPLDWWLDKSNVLQGQPLRPLQHTVQLFTDASNEGWGAHLGDSTAIGIWSLPESHLHINFLGVKSSPSGPQEFRASLQGPDCSCSNRQLNCSLLHKQTGRYEIRLSLCPPLETSVAHCIAEQKLL